MTIQLFVNCPAEEAASWAKALGERLKELIKQTFPRPAAAHNMVMGYSADMTHAIEVVLLCDVGQLTTKESASFVRVVRQYVRPHLKPGQEAQVLVLERTQIYVDTVKVEN